MDLNIFKKKDEGDIEHYWSIVVGKTWVQAGVWRVVEEHAELVAEGNSTSWVDGNEESLVAAADGSLSSAASNTSSEIPEPNKVVYGLPSSWITDGNITSQRLDLLKKLSSELELTPAGFVVVPEAIVHYLKSKEGSPLNAILVGISEDSVEITLSQNGKVLGTSEVSRSVSLGTDLAEGLGKISPVSQNPSRILLYNHKVGNLDDARQNLLATNWKDVKLDFLHTPKIEVLPEDTALCAVSLAGGAEVGEAKNIVLPRRITEEVIEDEESEKVLEEPEKEEENLPETQNLEEINFLRDEDIAESKDLPSTKTQDFESDLRDLDIGEHDNLRQPIQDPRVKDFNPFPQKTKRNIFLTFFNLFKLPSLGKFEILILGKGFFGVAGVGVVLLLIVGGLGYWYLPKAEVTVYVAARKLEKIIPFNVDISTSVVDLANSVVPAKSFEIEVSGEKTTSTTGVKLVGDRAKGVVIITNGGGSRVLKSGTTLTGPNNLKFTLTEDTTVSSASSIAKPSIAQVPVAASDIGAQFNLAGGSEFTVANFSKLDIVAQNNDPLSGGSSREISAVSEKDKSSLEEGLNLELIEKGKEQAKNSQTDNEILVEESSVFTPSEKNFSNKVGEEAQTLKLVSKGQYKSLVIPKESVNSLVLEKLKGEVPEGFLLRPDQITLSFKTVVEKKAETTKPTKKEESKPQTTNPKTSFIAQVQVNLLPKINPDEVKKEISGKSPMLAKDYLSSIPGFTRTAISFKPRLPSFLQVLPRITNNILLEIEAER